MKTSFLYLFALSIIWAYDKADLKCSKFCFYKGQPILKDPGNIESHILREKSGFFGGGLVQIKVKNTGQVLTKDELDSIVEKMDEAYKNLIKAHPRFDWKHPEKYGTLDIYDEYGRATTARASKIKATSNDWSRLDSWDNGIPISFGRWKKIYDMFRREVTNDLTLTRWYRYLGQHVMHENKKVKLPYSGKYHYETEDDKEVTLDQFMAALTAVEQGSGKDVYQKDKARKEFYDTINPKVWDPTDPLIMIGTDGAKKTILDLYARPIDIIKDVLSDSHGKPLNAAALNQLITHPRAEELKAVLHGTKWGRYNTYRGVHIKEGDADIIEEKHTVNGVQEWFKVRGGRTVTEIEYINILDNIDEEKDGHRRPGPTPSPSPRDRRETSAISDIDIMQVSVESESEDEVVEEQATPPPAAEDTSAGNMFASVSLGFLALSLLVAF